MTKQCRMDMEDKLLAKASGVWSLSSSVHRTPEKNGHSDYASESPEIPLAFVKYEPKKDLQNCSDHRRKQSASSRSKMVDHSNLGTKPSKKQDQKRSPSSQFNLAPSKKQPRKGENPTRLSRSEDFTDSECATFWICKNSACRAHIPSDKTFCKRCSCCICHSFDENKDPSLWLECTSEVEVEYHCGYTCHIECSLKSNKVGVVNLGQLMQLDGSYCCTSCGKVSCILGTWRKQMVAAKDARRVDILCYRVSLSYRLLDGTSRFKEIHEIAKEAKVKLENEVGPLNEGSSTMHRGIVSRLSVANDVQNLCSIAIQKVDDVLVMLANQGKGNSLPPACRFIFQEVTCSSVVIVLVELSSLSSEKIKGYKLRYFKSRAEKEACKFLTILSRNREKILISNLQPCTEYTFEVVSYNKASDLGHSSAKCFTKSKEIIHKNLISAVVSHSQKANCNGEQSPHKKNFEPASGACSPKFNIRDLGKVLQQAHKQGVCFDDFSSAEVDKKCRANTTIKLERKEQFPQDSSSLIDLNVFSVPDLNEEAILTSEDNDCVVLSHHVEKDCHIRSQVSSDTLMWVHGQTLESQPEPCQIRITSTTEEAHDSDSALLDNSLSGASNGSGGLDENFEYCVKMIRWLECESHINKEFRLKLLTWYSMRSTEQERRVVSAFVQHMIDDPSSLAAQLIDSFSDLICNKKP